MNLPWFRNADGKKDAMLSFAIVSFAVVILKVLFGGMIIAVSGKTFTIGTIDASIIAAMLTPTLGSYVARRHTDAKFSSEADAAAADEAKDSALTRKADE